MWSVLFTDGHLHLKDIRPECIKEKWIPVCTWDDEIVTFFDSKKAKKFIKLNLPADWAKGAVYLSPDELEWIKNQNWRTRLLTFPQRIPFEKLSFKIIELQQEADLTCSTF
jgi:hypothetical protein